MGRPIALLPYNLTPRLLFLLGGSLPDRFDFEPTGAWLLGHDARATLQEHSPRFDQVMGALDAVLEPEIDAPSSVNRFWPVVGWARILRPEILCFSRP